MARDVFISYSQPDRECAFDLVARLEGQGIQCWIAPRNIAPSADWASEIMDAISSVRTMILVFSASSNESPQVRREVERAVHKQLNILPFRIEDVLPSKSLEFFLSTQHWMDAFPPPREPHYARLCEHLKIQLATDPVPRIPSNAISATGSNPPLIDSGEQLRIERVLAGFIGPVAKHLVRTAASRTTGHDALVALLAVELDSESERQDFTRKCRGAAHPGPQ